MNRRARARAMLAETASAVMISAVTSGNRRTREVIRTVTERSSARDSDSPKPFQSSTMRRDASASRFVELWV